MKTTLGRMAVALLLSAIAGCSDDNKTPASDAGVTPDTTGGHVDEASSIDVSADHAAPETDASTSRDAALDSKTGDAVTADTMNADIKPGDANPIDGGGAADGEAGAAPPKASSCSIVSDKKTPIPDPAGRVVYCGIDIGSKNVKMSVVSLEQGKPSSIKDERQCKRNLGLGTQVFDASTGTAFPLSDESTGYLIDTIKEFQTICALDKGALLGVDATQWARDATNIKDVAAKVKAMANLDLDVLTGEQEGRYGYVAATLDTAGHISLDPGSNSFQVSWRPSGSIDVGTVSVPLGYVRGSTNDVEPAADFATGRATYVADASQQLGDALGKLSPPMSLAAIKQLVTDGKVGKEIVVVGQDAALDVIIRGKVKDSTGTWISDSKAYDDLIAAQPSKIDPTFGIISADPFVPSELTTYLNTTVGAPDFATLKTEPVRTTYGQKALVTPALLDLLMTQLGVEKIVLVPQELVTGYILVHLPPTADN